MNGYVDAALLRFCHFKHRQQNSPHPHAPSIFGAKVQYSTPANDSPILPDKHLKYIQQVVGVFLYYGIAIDNTILIGIGDIAAKQSVSTANNTACVDHLLDYLASNPNDTIRYHASGMVLFIHSDASYLSVAKDRICASGVYFLSDPKPDTITFNDYTTLLNVFVHVLCKILRNIMASAVEAEYGALFLNGQATVLIRTTLTKMGHSQPPTPIQVDNAISVVISNKNIRQKMSKSMDMRFHWI